jgi:cytochrome oxidase Cu insertion factor (SCO1/SenC/PrrC family)
MHKCFHVLVLVMCLTATAWSQALGPKDGANLPPADLTRIKVGEAAPDFTLSNQDGQPVTLSSYRDSKPVVLVFYRGYW